MTSAIIRTNPTAGTATTSSVRDNFGAAADEINVLQRSSTELKSTTSGPIAYAVDFGSSPVFSLVDGARISVRINVTNTASPLITVSPGISPIGIVKPDGSALVAGDLVADSIYDLMYNATTSKWVALNVDVITSQDALLTTILGGLYPVGGLLTTTNSANPGDADYFFSGITFGTWEAYAQGRTIVGIDTDATLLSGGITSDVATFVTEAAHNLLVGSQVEIVSVTGVVSPVGTHYVTAIPTTTSFSFALVGTDEIFTNFTAASLAKNIAFNTSQEVGGESSHQITNDEIPDHNHQWNNHGAGDDRRIDLTSSGGGLDHTYNTDGDPLNYSDDELSHDAWTSKKESVAGGEDADRITNLQPYITTYIWKRVVTP
ncbi:hypothetical protein N9123_01910 [Pseudomonadales bacterium]|nr:hypothetical protein [Pseudomonadales bacterium]